MHASVAEWSIATDCKSVALWATKVRILPGAPIREIPTYVGISLI